MNISPTPATNNTPKTRNQIILDLVKANENLQLAELSFAGPYWTANKELGWKESMKYIGDVQDMRPAPIKKLVPLEQVIECLPQKLTDAQKAMLGVAAF